MVPEETPKQRKALLLPTDTSKLSMAEDGILPPPLKTVKEKG